MVLDFETYWDRQDYTLSKMTTEEYIRDPRFRAHGLAWKWLGDTAPATWVSHDGLPEFFSEHDWNDTAILAHNAQFDVSIAQWVYGIRPGFILDSLSMGRALRSVEVGNSLAKLAEFFGLPPKGNAVYSTSGMTYLDPNHPVEQELADYCRHDVWLCEQIFNRFAPGYPKKELRLIDMTLRMFTEPQLRLDPVMLQAAIVDERDRRESLLSRLDVEESALASNDQFAVVLRQLGVEPPTKVSKTTGKEAFAFAKNDAHFQALLQSDNEDVALLCEARLAVKSTLERTRAQRFLDIAGRGLLPVPLDYWKAHTGRWAASKGSGLNMQNLKRGSFLRRSIMAPDGSVMLVWDLSQIEPRVLAWLAGYDAMLDIFRQGGDPYAHFGAQMFGIPGLTKDSHPLLRQSAKSALLGAGYGLGWASFAAQLLTGFLGAPPVLYDRAFAKQLGITGQWMAEFLGWQKNLDRMAEIPHLCTEDELMVHCAAAKMIIDKYRAAADPVVDFWKLCDQALVECLIGGREYTHKCITFKRGEIVLPSGMSLRYPDLQSELDEAGRPQWTYAAGNKRKKLYGGKIAENITQAVARCIMTDGMLRIQVRYPCVLTVHDEAGALAPEEEARDAYDWGLEQMIVEPAYMPGIPLAADGGYAYRYGDAKN